MDLLDIDSFKKNEIILRIRDKGKEKLIVAYNKKKITDNDIIKAAKKSSDIGLPYIILGLGAIPKKLEGLIEALRNMSSIDQIK